MEGVATPTWFSLPIMRPLYAARALGARSRNGRSLRRLRSRHPAEAVRDEDRPIGEQVLDPVAAEAPFGEDLHRVLAEVRRRPHEVDRRPLERGIALRADHRADPRMLPV